MVPRTGLLTDADSSSAQGILANGFLHSQQISRNWSKKYEAGPVLIAQSFEDNAIYLALAGRIGSGGSGATNRMRIWLQGTNALIEECEPRSFSVDYESMTDVANKIASIRSSLSLKVREVAHVMLVERPTIYSWISGVAQPQKQNRNRLELIYRLATKWSEYSDLPLGHLRKEIGKEGKSVIDLLTAPDVDISSVDHMLRAAARRLDLAAKGQHGRSEEGRGLRLRDRALQGGESISRFSEARREIDRMTGKRVTQNE